MATKKPACAQYEFDLELDVLPLIKLARWAAHAGAVLSEIRTCMVISSQYSEVMNGYFPGMTFPENSNPGEMVEAVLCLAETLLERHIQRNP